MARIICDIVTCENRDKSQGFCTEETIHLQGCAPDSDNVVACSEFYEAPPQAEAEGK